MTSGNSKAKGNMKTNESRRPKRQARRAIRFILGRSPSPKAVMIAGENAPKSAEARLEAWLFTDCATPIDALAWGPNILLIRMVIPLVRNNPQTAPINCQMA